MTTLDLAYSRFVVSAVLAPTELGEAAALYIVERGGDVVGRRLSAVSMATGEEVAPGSPGSISRWLITVTAPAALAAAHALADAELSAAQAARRAYDESPAGIGEILGRRLGMLVMFRFDVAESLSAGNGPARHDLADERIDAARRSAWIAIRSGAATLDGVLVGLRAVGAEPECLGGLTS